MRLRLRWDALVLRAPADGILDAPRLRHSFGKRVPAGEVLGEILRPGLRRVHLRVPERLVDDVRPGAFAEMKTVAYPSRVFRGEVAEILPERAPDSAWDVRTAEADPTLVPRAFYIVVTEFEDAAGLLRTGMTGRVRVHCRRLSPAEYATRWLKRFYGGKVWL